MTVPRAGLALVAASLAVAGCGSAALPPPAAEPASAPVPTARPAGRVVAVGPGAEGVAADGRTGLVAVAVRAPYRLVFVRAATGRVVRTVPLPQPARHLTLTRPGGPVLVPAERADRLLVVPQRPGRVRSVPVGAHPHDAVSAGSRIFAGDEFGSAVSVIRHDREVRRLPAPRQPGGLAVLDGDTLGVVCVGSQQLRVFDVRTGRPEGVAVAGAGPTHLVPGARRRFYVVDTRGDAIVVFGLAGGLHVVGRVPAPGAPYGIAIDPARHRLWVTETARNRLGEWALGSHRPVPVASYPTVRQPNSVAVDPATGRVIVAGAARGELQLLDPPR